MSTSLLFTLSFCLQAAGREALPGQGPCPGLKLKGNKSFPQENRLLQPELSRNSRCCIETVLPSPAQDFGLLLPGITDLSPKLCASVPSHMPALQTGLFSIFPKGLVHSSTTGRTPDLAEPQKELTSNACTVPFFRTECTVQRNKRRYLSPKMQSPSQISWELWPSTREENRTCRVSALSAILHTKGF